MLGNEGAPGVDRQTVDDFGADRFQELARLESQLREDKYRPAAVRRTWIPKPGSNEKRPLGIPTVRDRVVQTEKGEPRNTRKKGLFCQQYFSCVSCISWFPFFLGLACVAAD